MSSGQGFDNLAYAKDSRSDVEDKNLPKRAKEDKKGKRDCLLFLVVVFFLAIVGLIIALVIVTQKDEEKEKGKEKIEQPPETCVTADCIQAAAWITEYVDTSVNPCDDFYTFTCGRWKQKNIIPEDRSVQSMFGLLVDEIDVVLKYLLEDEENFNDNEAIMKAKDMYTACVDLDTIEQKGSSVALPLLEEFGGWPVLGTNPGGNWNESDFSLVRLLTTLRKYNNAPIIDLYVNSDVKDSDKSIIYLDQPYFGLPGRLYYLLPELDYMREAYVNFASSVAVLFGADQAEAELAMNEVLELETEIANITMPSEDRRDYDALYNKMTLSELKQNFTEPGPSDDIQFDWLEYVSEIMDRDSINIQINESEYVVVEDVPYYQRLFSVLQKYEKRVITNYIIWFIMKNRVYNLDSRFIAVKDDYLKVLYGVQTSLPRWKSCIAYVESRIGMAVGHMFIQETFDDSAKNDALEMIGHIREAFTELLDKVDWMDRDTKEAALEKMEAMKSWIGYPDYINDPNELKKLYENVTVDRNEYFSNVLHELKRTSSEGLRKLRETFDKTKWLDPPSMVNAFYDPIANNIIFPAGILQPPFYGKDLPQAINFGGIGTVIGHEITHGFDDQGRQFDKDGNLEHWWTDEIVENFKEKAQCMIDQYGNFVVPEANLTINGINTQGENIADNGGLKQSFKAYRSWVEKRGSEEPILPGLNYTGNQLFFISYGQTWCYNARKEAIIRAINTGVHSPSQFRVIGTLQNSKEFSDTFGCSNDDYMNPPGKCSVW